MPAVDGRGEIKACRLKATRKRKGRTKNRSFKRIGPPRTEVLERSMFKKERWLIKMMVLF